MSMNIEVCDLAILNSIFILKNYNLDLLKNQEQKTFIRNSEIVASGTPFLNIDFNSVWNMVMKETYLNLNRMFHNLFDKL